MDRRHGPTLWVTVLPLQQPYPGTHGFTASFERLEQLVLLVTERSVPPGNLDPVGVQTIMFPLSQLAHPTPHLSDAATESIR